MGYLIRNEDGVCCLAAAAPLQVSPAKLLSCLPSVRHGLSSQQFIFTTSKIFIESDGKGAILLIEGQQASTDQDINNIVIEIRFLLSRMSNCSIHFAPREVNGAANWLAKYASITATCNSWTNSWPPELLCILTSDMGGTSME